MRKISLKILMIFTSSILLSTNVLAYIDPSTGGVLFNTIWPLIVAFFSAALAFIVKWFWNPIKKMFLKLKPTK